ncbi:MAG: Hsp33 family molecular chaperone HslO [Candidatus Cloacimonadota bacterium]|jgi:molecular chaperone Hsp33|nr:Hsp33 family molecular chaperone HslO [Candidatus Cloacimonadota bacterium]
MNKQDMLYRGMAMDGQFRVFAAQSTQTVQTARDLHDLSPINTFLLGKMLTAAAMLSLELKGPGSEVSLRLDGDGELRGALVMCNDLGELRGYAFAPSVFFEEAAENFLPVKHLGSGSMTVIRSVAGKQPTMGHTTLVEGEVAQNLAHYFEQSEQIPTAVNLGVLIDKEARVRAAGGLLIQQLPQADPARAELLIARLASTPNISDLMDMGLGIPQILKRFLFTEKDFSLEEAHPIKYKCNCSRERFERGLRLLGKEELSEMLDGVEPQCHFCNASYHFSGKDIAGLIASLERKG